ncbi:ABC transporter ATP-binding protein [Agromyces aurantiacus]|uniref:ABC transporter ATP-binding protein n=1 Tax=Agromyces aurantiacus TaxID=165814 RepID=A0ABV9R3V2_9MICO|nr:ABC transporter ATP-binding protein [Agromyces aurantiacus]MBM7502859.1 putative lysophospholipase L1 biosynthesis ABC-type transport system permease subunit [Agromyces aurantiacus]
MTQSPGDDFRPSRRDVLRPAEYVGGAAIAAVFTAAIVLMVTRDWLITLIALGGVFIIVLMVLALLAMTVKPNPGEHGDGTGGDPMRRDPSGPSAH